MPGFWRSFDNPPTFNVDAMLLLTDGAAHGVTLTLRDYVA
jgi:hypothetical protein